MQVHAVASEVGQLLIYDKLSLPFPVRRIYTIHGVPAGVTRGHHAHKSLQQLMFVPVGEVLLSLDDGIGNRIEYVLSDRTPPVLVSPGMWRTLQFNGPSTLCVVLASENYVEGDYIRDYREFLEWKTNSLTS